MYTISHVRRPVYTHKTAIDHFYCQNIDVFHQLWPMRKNAYCTLGLTKDDRLHIYNNVSYVHAYTCLQNSSRSKDKRQVVLHQSKINYTQESTSWMHDLLNKTVTLVSNWNETVSYKISLIMRLMMAIFHEQMRRIVKLTNSVTPTCILSSTRCIPWTWQVG